MRENLRRGAWDVAAGHGRPNLPERGRGRFTRAPSDAGCAAGKTPPACTGMATLPPGTAVSYAVSADGCRTWTSAPLFTNVTVPAGDRLCYRLTLATSNPAATPVVDVANLYEIATVSSTATRNPAYLTKQDIREGECCHGCTHSCQPALSVTPAPLAGGLPQRLPGARMSRRRLYRHACSPCPAGRVAGIRRQSFCADTVSHARMAANGLIRQSDNRWSS